MADNGKTPDKGKKKTTKGNKRTNKRTTIEPNRACLFYLAQGEKRSLRTLLEDLLADGHKISLSTLEVWSRRDHWVDQAQEFDRVQLTQSKRALMLHETDSDVRHASLGRAVQSHGKNSLDALVKKGDTGLLHDPRDISLFIKSGIDIENAALGKGSGTEVDTYNGLIMPILALFQATIIVLDDGTQKNLARAFAEGVNGIRDTFLPMEAE